GEHLDELAEARRARRGGAEEHDKRADAVGDARGLAQEIADDLGKLMPKPSDTLTPGDREAARGQAEKQSAIGKRTDEVAEEAARRLGKMPGMEQAEGELKGAGARMREAGESLKRDESKPAATAERDAADRLAPGAARRHEREGARALPRRGPALLRGAGQMKRLVRALAAGALALAFAGDARGGNPPPDFDAAAKHVDELLDTWQFKDAAAALAAL